jgi:hypothetical protein
LSKAVGNGSGANVRQQPNAGSTTLLLSIENNTLTVSRNVDDWYHIRTADSLAGFAYQLLNWSELRFIPLK